MRITQCDLASFSPSASRISSIFPLAPWIKTTAGSAPGKPELSHLQAYVLDLDKLPGWRMRRLNSRNANRGNGHEHAKHNDKRRDDGSHGDIMGPMRVQKRLITRRVPFAHPVLNVRHRR